MNEASIPQSWTSLDETYQTDIAPMLAPLFLVKSRLNRAVIPWICGENEASIGGWVSEHGFDCRQGVGTKSLALGSNDSLLLLVQDWMLCKCQSS